MAERVYVTKKEFRNWVQMVHGRQYGPDYYSAKIQVYFQLSETVEVRLNATAIHIDDDGLRCYGRARAFTHVRVETYAGVAFNYFGKGARSTETHELSQEILDLLTGGEVPSGETKVRIVEEKATPTSKDANRLVPLVNGPVNYRLDAGIQSRDVAPSCQDADSHCCSSTDEVSTRSAMQPFVIFTSVSKAMGNTARG